MTTTTVRRRTALALATTVAAATAGVAPALAVGPSDVAYPIPDVQSARIDGMPLRGDLGQYARVAPVLGAMSCDPGNPGGTEPIAGRSWVYYAGAGRLGDPSADVVVTGWVDGKAAFDGLGATTACRFTSGWKRLSKNALTLTYGKGDDRAVVSRVGNLLVAVRVDKGTADHALKVARGEAARLSGVLTVDYPAPR